MFHNTLQKITFSNSLSQNGTKSKLISLEMESTALPPLSDPALPPCSAGDVLKVEPSVAAVLPASSSLPGAEAVVSDRCPASKDPPTYIITKILTLFFVYVAELNFEFDLQLTVDKNWSK